MYHYTIVIIKPDAVKAGNVGAIISELEKLGQIEHVERFKFSKEAAQLFYREHKGKDFFDRQVEFMCSGDCYFIWLGGMSIISKVRNVIGNSDPEKAEDGTIRKKFGSVLPCNAIHASANETDYWHEMMVLQTQTSMKSVRPWK